MFRNRWHKTLAGIGICALFTLSAIAAEPEKKEIVPATAGDMQTLILELRKTNELLAAQNAHLLQLHNDLEKQNKAYKEILTKLVQLMKNKSGGDDTAMNSIMKVLDEINAGIGSLRQDQ
ncbi:MAG: hypothetical protein JXR25_09275 [Pontiellaceae bacterium]|nr:hypothetical protein [Pontiellaceae bacterium]MBN2785006.1 hypothetical protein [Pontiellaceae bacterium]